MDRSPVMKVSRAAFLKACGAALLVVGVGVDARALFDTPAKPPAVPERALVGSDVTFNHGADRFREHLNTSFSVRAADGARARMVLTQIVEHPITRNVEQFSLIFHAPRGTTVPHGTHAVQHQTLGDFDLFVVPIGVPNGRRTVYQACFSRHLTAHEVEPRQALAASPRRRM
jgi:hypothetical protein